MLSIAGLIVTAAVCVAAVLYLNYRARVDQRARALSGDTSPTPKRTVRSRVFAVVLGLALFGLALLMGWPGR